MDKKSFEMIAIPCVEQFQTHMLHSIHRSSAEGNVKLKRNFLNFQGLNEADMPLRLQLNVSRVQTLLCDSRVV